VNQFNHGLGKSDLARLVANFNATYAGKRTSRNQLIPTLTLPNSYQLGDGFFSQDLRVGRLISLTERWRLQIFGEVFNLFNVSNLIGYQFGLESPGSFGQPTSRTNQIFGSGGPRAFQLGARATF